jgi:hypothetical protein
MNAGASEWTRSVMWHGVDPFSTEILHLRGIDRTWEMRGVVLIDLPQGATEIRYTLSADDRWRSRRVHVEMLGAHTGSMTLIGDGEGAWHRSDARIAKVDGCVDLDLGVTPATNTLPIRRLDAAVGDTITTRVAWVRFPELTIEPDEQTYERLADRRWLFRSDDFVAELDVDEDGLVVRYGDLWTRVAATAG